MRRTLQSVGERMTGLDVRVLRACPPDGASLQHRTAGRVGELTGVDESVIASVLRRLRARGLVEHDGEYRRAWARTHAGDVALEHCEP
ncbi:MAG: hypothetical protein M3Y17_07865 [Actinomycetota bacterium]|nr:hypothetical protein [Actinomycetota bacterium]